MIPKLLEEREIVHNRLTELHRVETMHDRKAKMIELADGFIALPGGPGTLEELFEVITWAQIGLHQKPIGLLNSNHYFKPMLHLLQHMVDQKFLDERFKSMIMVESDPEKLMDRIYHYKPHKLKTYEQ